MWSDYRASLQTLAIRANSKYGVKRDWLDHGIK